MLQFFKMFYITFSTFILLLLLLIKLLDNISSDFNCQQSYTISSDLRKPGRKVENFLLKKNVRRNIILWTGRLRGAISIALFSIIN